jgi:membrane-associated phospholipid phosphatase
MTLVDVLVQVGASTVTLVTLSLLGIVGIDRMRSLRTVYRERIVAVSPYVGVLGLILLANSQLRNFGNQISLDFGLRITGNIYDIEGAFVAWVQSFQSPELTLYFSLIYVYGYVYLLVFPFLAFAMLDESDRFRKLVIAYGLNYTIGLACYILFVAYGPRNLLPGQVEGLLYTTWPQSQLLTSEVNTNTNVFPSLHSSLAVTVALLARKTREEYPYWYPIAIVLAVSVCLSTMYLGIHWGTDVVAGILLALLSVRASDWLLPVFETRFPPARVVYARVADRAGDALGRFRS